MISERSLTLHRSVAITGRFQPFHLDHLALVRHGFEFADKIIVGVTNPDTRSLKSDPASDHRHKPEANPFTFNERLTMIEQSLVEEGISRELFTIVPFPLDTPAIWRDCIPLSNLQLVRTFETWEYRKSELLEAGGYAVKTIEGNPAARISGRDIRDAMSNGAEWQHLVPTGTADTLLSIGLDEIRRRCAGVTTDACTMTIDSR